MVTTWLFIVEVLRCTTFISTCSSSKEQVSIFSVGKSKENKSSNLFENTSTNCNIFCAYLCF